MDHIKSKSSELIQQINSITDLIATNLSQQTWVEINELLSHRQTLMTELLSLHMTEMSTQELVDYLAEIRKRDNVLMQKISAERDQVKENLLKVSKVKQYLL